MNLAFAIVTIAACSGSVMLAQAAEPSTIMGKWIERRPDGMEIVTEFSPTSMAFYTVDKSGKPTGEPKRTSVIYKDLGGDSISVTVGDGRGGIVVQRKSANVVTVDFPGAYAVDLTRLPSN